MEKVLAVAFSSVSHFEFAVEFKLNVFRAFYAAFFATQIVSKQIGSFLLTILLMFTSFRLCIFILFTDVSLGNYGKNPLEMCSNRKFQH